MRRGGHPPPPVPPARQDGPLANPAGGSCSPKPAKPRATHHPIPAPVDSGSVSSSWHFFGGQPFGPFAQPGGAHAGTACDCCWVALAVAVLPDGRVVSGGHDGRIIVWNSAKRDAAPHGEDVLSCRCEVHRDR